MNRALTTKLHVQIFDAQRVFLDERAARFDHVAHRGGENLVGADRVFDLHLEPAVSTGRCNILESA